MITTLWINRKFIYFSGNPQSIISFRKITNLIKTYLASIANKYPKIQEPILPDLKKVGCYKRVFTVASKGRIFLYQKSTYWLYKGSLRINIYRSKTAAHSLSWVSLRVPFDWAFIVYKDVYLTVIVWC